MSWIQELPDDDPIFAKYRGPHGVDNIVRVQGLAPNALHCHMALYKELMFGAGELSRAQREAIAVAVSKANACEY